MCPPAAQQGQEAHLLPVCLSQVHSPGVQHPGGLRGAAEADRRQGNLVSTKKQKRIEISAPGVAKSCVSAHRGGSEEG